MPKSRRALQREIQRKSTHINLVSFNGSPLGTEVTRLQHYSKAKAGLHIKEPRLIIRNRKRMIYHATIETPAFSGTLVFKFMKRPSKRSVEGFTRDLGRMAEISQALNKFGQAYLPQQSRGNIAIIVTPLFEGITLGAFLFDRWRGIDLSRKLLAIRRVFHLLGEYQRTYGFVHRDFHYENIIIDSDDNPHFIDFENSLLNSSSKPMLYLRDAKFLFDLIFIARPDLPFEIDGKRAGDHKERRVLFERYLDRLVLDGSWEKDYAVIFERLVSQIYTSFCEPEKESPQAVVSSIMDEQFSRLCDAYPTSQKTIISIKINLETMHARLGEQAYIIINYYRRELEESLPHCTSPASEGGESKATEIAGTREVGAHFHDILCRTSLSLLMLYTLQANYDEFGKYSTYVRKHPSEHTFTQLCEHLISDDTDYAHPFVVQYRSQFIFELIKQGYRLNDKCGTLNHALKPLYTQVKPSLGRAIRSQGLFSDSELAEVQRDDLKFFLRLDF